MTLKIFNYLYSYIKINKVYYIAKKAIVNIINITPGIYDILQEDNSWVRIGNGIWIKYDSKWSIIYESKKEEPKPIVEQSKEDIVEEIKETIETPKIEKSKVRLLFEKVLDLLNKMFKSKG